MKKTILLLSLALAMAHLQAQNYQLSFEGTGASNTVESVQVQNITQCTSVDLMGGDTLQLSASTGINNIDTEKEYGLYIYPNPMTTYSNIEFESPVSGNATIEIYDINSKKIIQTQKNLQQGIHSYRMSGINHGIYLIHINSETYSYCGKFISNCKAAGTPNITYQTQSAKNEIPGHSKTATIREVKGANSTIQMQYNTGDLLKITGTSGMYQTILIIEPANSQMITFNFVACTDADGNNYSVVQIGSQLWMAENLKNTTYSEGTSIPNVTDNATWNSLTTGGYCHYNNTNNTDTITAYGYLYNWHAVTDAHNIAPAGWHMPTDDEWTSLVTFLGGASEAGDELKESCSVYGFYPNSNTTNETGFTAKPGGVRYGNGSFHDIGNTGTWWSSTEQGTTFAWHWSIDNSNNVSRLYGYKTAGLSVRCVRD